MTSTPLTPRRAQSIGMWLFLTSLIMLFAAGMLGYVVIRLTSATIPDTFHLQLPWTLWISTAIVLSASFTMHRALVAVRRERQAELRKWLILTAVVAVAFIGVQIPSMLAMLASHAQLRDSHMPLYGLIFFLVLVHAAHVLGGLIALGLTIHKAFGGGYDHENHIGITHAVLYWHFLDIVWLVMFGTMLVLG